MNELILSGLDGSNPLAFLAALGLFRVVDRAESLNHNRRSTVRWVNQAGWRPALASSLDLDGVIRCVLEDRERCLEGPLLQLRYFKMEKRGPKVSRALRIPVPVLRAWCRARLEIVESGSGSLGGRSSREAAYHEMGHVEEICGLVSEMAVEPIGGEDRIPPATLYEEEGVLVDTVGDHGLSTLPTFFDFTSRNAQFLDQAGTIGRAIDEASIRSELLSWTPCARTKIDRELRWDTGADVPGALTGNSVRPLHAVAEWLAFRSLAWFPVLGRLNECSTTGCEGKRKSGVFQWPVWTASCSSDSLRSLLASLPPLGGDCSELAGRGVVRVFSSELAKAADGYDGIFRPSRIR